MTPKIGITLDRRAERELAVRVEKLKAQGPPLTLSPEERAIQFLRGVNFRAKMALTAFYLFIGSKVDNDQACAIEGLPGVVFKHVTEFSSINTVSLACRKLFDHKVSGLTGANFAKSSDKTLRIVAKHWCKQSNQSPKDAFLALEFLRSIFQTCAKGHNALLKESDLLSLRIGLIKQHADRRAAHLSMENFAFTVLDCAHVVAAIVVIGEVVRSFDGPNQNSNYFDLYDDASLSASRQLFPSMPNPRLLKQIKIEKYSQECWQSEITQGREMILNKLPYEIGWF